MQHGSTAAPSFQSHPPFHSPSLPRMSLAIFDPPPMESTSSFSFFVLIAPSAADSDSPPTNCPTRAQVFVRRFVHEADNNTINNDASGEEMERPPAAVMHYYIDPKTGFLSLNRACSCSDPNKMRQILPRLRSYKAISIVAFRQTAVPRRTFWRITEAATHCLQPAYLPSSTTPLLQEEDTKGCGMKK